MQLKTGDQCWSQPSQPLSHRSHTSIKYPVEITPGNVNPVLMNMLVKVLSYHVAKVDLPILMCCVETEPNE